ncbi:MAG TPA: transglycosylase SLT domain-containing protein [Candidatus Limnocylindria bacterium]|nr:transglycosylase SLT domain-containing protein [Candidatus Limnocylindria bacterium]
MRLRAVIASVVVFGTLAMPVPALAGERAAPLDRGTARLLLIQAARHHGLRPGFVLAVAYWESGWNQQAVSRTGAIGLMQVEPSTAAWAGPALLHRRVNLYNPHDNAEMGAALLRYYLDRLHSPALALAAYYQGFRATIRHGIYRSSRRYVQGILRLAKQF